MSGKAPIRKERMWIESRKCGALNAEGRGAKAGWKGRFVWLAAASGRLGQGRAGLALAQFPAEGPPPPSRRANAGVPARNRQARGETCRLPRLVPLWHHLAMMSETENQFSLSRAASKAPARARTKCRRVSNR